MAVPPFPLNRLLDDLLIVVFEKLSELSPNSLRSCSAVCHRFYRVAVPIIYRHVVIKAERDLLRVTRLLRKHSNLPKFVRSVWFYDRAGPNYRDPQVILDLLHAFDRLDEITIATDYPPSDTLLQLIADKFPDVVLIVRVLGARYRTGGALVDSEGRSLTGLQLRSIFMTGFFPTNRTDSHPLASVVFNIIKGCPNLYHISGRPHPADVMLKDASRFPEISITITPTDVLPTLRELHYVPFSAATFRAWSAVNGWRNLHTLMITNIHCLPVLAGNVPSLKALSIYGATSRLEELNQAANMRCPLKSLALIGHQTPQLPFPFLTQFSTTLEELILDPDLDERSNMLVQEIGHLQSACPNLQRLYLYFSTESEWHHEMLDALAQFQHLTSLVLAVKTSRVSLHLDQSDKHHLVATHQYIQERKQGVPLSILAHYPRIEARSNSRFENYLDHATNISMRSLSGELSIIRRLEIGCNSAVLNHCVHETKVKRLETQPFSRLNGRVVSRDDTLWFANRLEPEWAEKEAMTLGISKKSLDWVNYNFWHLTDRIANEREKLKEMVKEELEFWKRRQQGDNFYGPGWCLYDVLYTQPGYLPHAKSSDG